MSKYGRGRGQLLARRPGTFRTAYVAPAALLIYLLVLLPAAIIIGAPLSVALVPAATYLFLTIATALWIAWTLRRPAAAPLAATLIGVIHACYGGGVLRGLLSARHVPEVDAVIWNSAAHVAAAHTLQNAPAPDR